jgi:MoxR-like ATPase
MTKRTAPRRSRPVPLTGRLGVLGWSHLDPLVLAALALEAPVLLVGEHGTAKTLLVERIAQALGDEFRHYNASLLNYDDLVGIPIPDPTGTGLRFVGTEGSVWGASFLFFDELNRCRPDLQNKMFPLVHERRIAGADLPDLRHRWAAMNPPPASDGYDIGYIGAEPLDAALADRFWFVIRVPAWRDLTRAERELLVAGDVADGDKSLDLHALVADTRTAIDATDVVDAQLVVRYTVVLVDALRDAGIELSGRRAQLLARSVQATAAAARTLRSSAPADRLEALGEIAELVLRHALPHWADAVPPSVATVVAAHVQAWQLALDEDDTVKRRLLAEPDPVGRLHLGLQIGADDDTLGTLAAGALASLPTRAEQIGLAVVLSRSCGERPLTPAAWSTIHELSVRALRPARRTDQVAPGRRLEAWRRASALLVTIEAHADAEADLAPDGVDTLESALLNACGAELLDGVPIDRLSRGFRDHCKLFGVAG